MIPPRIASIAGGCLLAETKPSKLFECATARRQHANPRWTYRGSEVVTDLVSKGDVRNRRWYVFAVVEEGDYTCVQRFHATSVVLQDEIALVPGVIVWVSWNADPETMLYSRRRRISFVTGSGGGKRTYPVFLANSARVFQIAGPRQAQSSLLEVTIREHVRQTKCVVVLLWKKSFQFQQVLTEVFDFDLKNLCITISPVWFDRSMNLRGYSIWMDIGLWTFACIREKFKRRKKKNR